MEPGRFSQFGETWTRSAGESLSAMTERAGAIGAEAGELARRGLNDGAALISDLASAGSVERMQAIQADYARRAYADAVAGATRMGELYADLFRDVSRPFEAAVSRRR